ncbi:MAG: hypothetical protein ACRD15_20785 [Vicinamibacterales bacterium]
MIRLSRPERIGMAVWVGIAVVVWNGLYDLRITLGVRDYLLKTALHEAGRGPAVVMSEAMHATVIDAILVASLWGTIILIAGLATVRMLARSVAREHVARST